VLDPAAPLTLDQLAAITSMSTEEVRQALLDSPASAHWILASSLHAEILVVPWAPLEMGLLGELEVIIADEVLTKEEARAVYLDVAPRLPGMWQALCALPQPEAWLTYSTARGAPFPLTFAQDVAADVAQSAQ
jgi:hypothetical protein